MSSFACTFQVEAFLDLIKWDSKGLAVAIAQHVDTGAVLMQGFVNREAVSVTLASHRATFFSRSRSQLWTKGETSSNFIQVEDVFLDCDRDSVGYFLILFASADVAGCPLPSCFFKQQGRSCIFTYFPNCCNS